MRATKVCMTAYEKNYRELCSNLEVIVDATLEHSQGEISSDASHIRIPKKEKKKKASGHANSTNPSHSLN